MMPAVYVLGSAMGLFGMFWHLPCSQQSSEVALPFSEEEAGVRGLTL